MTNRRGGIAAEGGCMDEGNKEFVDDSLEERLVERWLNVWGVSSYCKNTTKVATKTSGQFSFG